MKRISTLSQTWGVRALVALGILSVLAPISGAGNLLSGFLSEAKTTSPVRTEVDAAAKKTSADATHRTAPMKATTPPEVKQAAETARRDVVCSLIIDNVSIGECRNDVETGFQSKVLVAVFVSWVDPPVGQNIEITVDGVTKTINPAEKGCANYVQFILDADGSSQVADAEFSGGTCSAPSVIFNLPNECAGSAPCAGATSIGGRVYSDFDSDGTLDASEFGLEGAQINLFDNNENLLCTATTDQQGEWTCTGLTAGQAIRAEISNFPSGYTPSGTGIDNNGGVVQFATVGSDCTVDFGLLDAGNFCENNPYVITPCYVRGDPSGGGTSGLMDVLVAVPYNASGNTSVNSYLTRNDEAGSMWGVAYQKESKKLFSSAFLKRHCGWGPAGLGGIYVTDVSTIPAPGVSTTGLTSVYFNLDAYGINTGNEASLTRNLGPNVNQPTYDGQVFDLVGKWGLGDIDITEDGDSLFIVNMFNRSLVTVAIGNPAVTPVPASAVSEVTIPDPGCSNASDWRPFALKYKNGKLYVGGVCSAQTSQDVDDLQAIIYEYSPAAGTFTEILNIPLGYDKGFVLTGLSHCENWNPWTNDFNDLPAGGIELCYPQPILSDIEFDVYGNMMVAFNDRGGHQMGWYDYGTTPPSTAVWKGNSGGDVLRVVNNNGTWLIERNATAGFDDGCGAGNGQGPCGGEFYCQDSYLSAHQEAVHGGIAVHPSNNELLLNMMDATSAFSGGLAWYNNASGIKNRAYRVYFSDNNGNNGTNGKAAGLGDVEILCGEAPIEIGNYVWADTDRDGIMDPGEPGLFGVNVALYKGGTQIATTTTNILGQYKFGGANILPNMAYCVAFGTGGQFSNGTLSIGGASYAMTLPNIGFGANADNNDSDVNPGGNTLPVAIQGLPVVCLVTGNRGDNDNTFDAGFFPVIDYGDLPDNNTAGTYPTDATNGGGEGVGPSHQIIPTLKMGASVDFENGGQSSALANGDDNNGTPDDENGVTLPMFVAGQSVNVPVVVMNTTGSVAKLTGFFDWNKNGNLLDAGEMFSVNVPTGTNGTVNLPVVVPATATLNMDLGVRFRLSTNATVSMLPTGAAPDGEVEDYLAQVMAFDFGDLPDNNTAGSYPTDGTDGAGEGIGASHKINGTLKLGASVDFESNGQPSALANGDDTNSTDDENGVASFPTLTAGQPATVAVNVMNMTGNAAVLFAYFDWNKDGDFSDANETVNVTIPDGTNGNVNVSVNVPVTATTNMNLGVRFRLSNDVLAAGTPNGLAPNGEVEDYVVEVECPVISLSTVVDNANCFGSTDGSIVLTVTGGSGTYTYDWSNDGPESPDNDPKDLSNVGAGTYTVTVTDITGCDAITSATVNQPTALVPTTAVTNVSCNGGADGAIDLGVSGGTLPYVYDWSNDGPESPDTDNQDLAGLTAGAYTVTITDINGCVTTTGATLSQPATGLNLTASQMNVSCNAGANGSINLTVSGGTSPYTYDWSNDGEEDPDNDNQDISGLAAGLYSVTVTDDNGCSDILNVTITEPAPVQLSTAIMDVPCTSGSNGGIVLTVTGGTPGYTYDWSNDGPDSPDNDPKDLTNVPAGTYTVTVTDANLCTAQTSVTVDEPMVGLGLDIAVANVNCTGAYDLTVSGGTPGYTYDWSNDGAENPDNDAQDITVSAAGTYTVTVTDANGCTAEASAPYNGCDYGDLADNNTPGSYPTDATNGAGEGVGPSHHVVPGIKMGATVDAEAGGASSANANGDDTAGSDDENGVAAFPMFVAGQTVTVSVNVMNMNPDDEAAKLTAYFDWNADGDFNDAGEMVSASVPQGTNGNINLSVPVPIGTSLNTNLGARFRLSTDTDASMSPTGPAPDGEVEDYLIQVMAFDYGDLADNDAAGSYPTNATNGAGEGVGASHKIIAGLKIGAIVDPEAAGQPSGTANGDDSATSDDEDGVTLPMFLANQAYTVPVVVMNMTGVQAKLTGFFDWNANGSLSDAGEMVSVNVPTGTNGVVNLSVSVPIDAVLNTALGARFRLSTDATASMNPSGPAPDGEVEDYQVTAVMAFDYGDLPDGNVPGDYPTDGTNGAGEGVGPSHKIVAGLKLGNIIDIDNFGVPSATAIADDAPNYLGQDDEDGVILPVFVAGQTATASVTAMNMTGTPATLYVYFDFNRDGDFADAGETFSVPVPNGTNGTFNVPVSVPVSAKLNTLLGIRFRLTNDPAFSGLATGPANSGEVEDYVAIVLGDDYGDLPDTYGTSGPNAPRHTVTPTLTLGGCIDNEAGGQPEPMAGAMTGGDDNTAGGTTIGTCAAGSDDENGIVFTTPLIPGAEACIRVTATNTTGAPASLQAWIDFNGDGDLLDGGEALSLTGGGVIPNGGVNNQQFCFTVPAGATFQGGQAMVRFRLSSTGGLAPNNGAAANGEIEDYKVALAKIGTFVWEDTNGDGIQNESGTNGINGASVQLVWAGPDNNLATNGDNITFGTTTSSMGGYNGQYMFLGLTPGTYRVGLPANPAGGFLPTATNQGGDDELDSDLASGETFVIPVNFNLPLSEDGVGDVPGGTNGFPDAQDNLTFDFGYYAPASIGNYTWIDANANGIQDPNEDPLPNVPVTLTGTTGSGVPVNQNATTNGSGLYNFPNLAPGSYKLTFGVPAASSYVSTDVNQGGNDASDSDADPAMAGMTVLEVLTSGENNTTYDAGFYIPAEIGNYTWIDENADGFQDPGEDPLPGVTVVLDGTTGTGEVVNLTAITDNNGIYTFTGLQPGSYKLTFVTPLGDYVSTLVNAPIANDANDSDADPNMGGMTVFEVLTSGESNLTYDAGYYEPASIGNFVWNDLDADGVQDSNEPGIGGVPVTLTGDDNQGNMIVLNTTTAPDGSYLFDGLVPGDYKLTFGTPAGFDFPSPVNAGGNDATDSDADPTMAGMTTFETLVSGEYNPTYDAGFYECPEITFKNLPVQPVCPGEDIAGIQIFTVPGAAVISWTGGSAIGLNNGTAPGPMAEIPAFIPTAEGTVTVTVTATLGQCTITNTFTITVNDATPPVFANCPNNVTVNNDVDLCSAVVWWTAPSATDNCDGQVEVTQTAGPVPGSIFDVNTTSTIAYTANDGNGNTALCSFTVTVEDNQNPTAVCQDVTINLDANGEASVTAAGIDGGSSDNCGPITLSACADEGFTGDFAPANWTVDVDGNGTVVFAAPGSVALTSSNNGIPNTESNVCIVVPVDGTISFQWDYQSFDVNGPYYDPFGYTVNGAFTKLSFDTGPGSNSGPTVQIGESAVVVTAGQNFCYSQRATDGILGASVTVSSLFVFEDNLCTYTCDNVGDNNAILTVIDAAGNASHCVATITVVDNLNPTMTCPAPLTAVCAAGEQPVYTSLAQFTQAGGTATDNCGIDAASFILESETDNGLTCPKTVTRTYRVSDESGNTVTCVQIITVDDNVVPTIEAPDALTLSCLPNQQNNTTAILDWLDDYTASDNCAGAISVTHDFDPSTIDYCTGGDITVTWTATDACGNVSTTAAQILITEDETPPVFVNCPTAITLNNDVDLCGTNATWSVPVANDACTVTATVTQTGGPGQGTFIPVGTSTVTYSAVDGCGNATTCAITITVEDNQNPTAVCEDVTINLNANGQASVTAAGIDGGSSDNCGPITLSACADEGFAGAFAPANWTVDVDGNGTVVFAAPGSVALTSSNNGIPNTESNVCIVVPVDGTISFQWDYQSFDVNGPYYDPFGYTVNGAFTKLSFDTGPGSSSGPTVQDGESAVVVTAGQNFCYSQRATDGILGASVTVSSLFVFEDNLCTYTCDNVGDNNAILTVIDAAGNASHCVATITVVDNLNPTMTCPAPLTAVCAAGEQPVYTSLAQFTQAGGTATDNCGIDAASFILESETDNGLTCPKTVTRTYRVSDESGNTVTCVQIITVDDNVVPTIEAPDALTLSCLPNQQNNTTAILDWLDDYTASDNCAGAISVTHDFDPSTIDYCTGGDITVTWTATDACGNVSTTAAQILITEDETAPVFVNCPTAITLNNDVDLCGTNATWSVPVANDACTVTATVTQTGGPGQGTFIPVGTSTVTYSAVDGCGNATTCAITITVEDNQNPTAVCEDVTIYLNANGQASVTAAGIDGGSSDNCGPITLSACADEGFAGAFAPANWTVDVDGNGTVVFAAPGSVALTSSNNGIPNTESNVCIVVPVDGTISFQWDYQSFDVNGPYYDPFGYTVNGAFTKLSFDTGPGSSSGPTVQDGESAVVVTAGQNFCYSQRATDGILGASVTVSSLFVFEDNLCTYTCDNVGDNNAILTVIDAAGNASHCVATITVVDNLNPTMTCPAPLTAVCAAGEQPVYTSLAQFTQAGGTATDNCGIDAASFILESETDNGLTCPKTVTRTYRVSDESGNTVTCVQIITVDDNVVPTIEAPDALTLSCLPNQQNNTTAILDWLDDYTASDNCAGAISVTHDFDPSTIDYCTGGDITVTWTATDACGNVSTTAAQILITEDETAPVFVNCPTAITLNNDVDLCGTNATWSVPVANDACTVTATVTQTGGPGQGTFIPVGTSTVTYSAVDGCGNATTCAITITVEDNQNPTAVCEDVTIYLNANGQASVTAAGIDGGSSDNCGPITLSACADEGFAGAFAPANWTVDVDGDGSVNTANAPASVTLTSNNAGGGFSETNLCIEVPVDGTISFQWEYQSFDVNGPFYDPFGYTVDGAFTKLTFDTGAGSNSGPLVQSGENAVVVTAGQDFCFTQRATDGILGAGVTLSSLFVFEDNLCTYTCDNVGDNNAILTVIDEAGNASHCVATITVLDTIKPTFTCPADITVSSCYDVVPDVITDIDDEDDNCAVASVTQNPPVGVAFGNINGGSTTITVTVTDVNGNVRTCDVDVTITDDTDPVITCPPSVVVGNDVDKCGANVTYSIPTATDDCPGVLVYLEQGDLASGALFPVGVTTVTYYATDAGDNTVSCEFTVEVMDMQTPTAVCEDITIFLNANGNATIVPADVDGGSTDNCGIETLSISESAFDCDEVGDNNVTLTVTDGAENTSICVATVTVIDSIKPTFTCPADVTVDGCDDLVPDVITGIIDEADNCGVASVVQNPVAGLDFGQTNGNSVVITVTVTDVNGNVATCEVDVIINDDDNPDFLNCPTSMIMIGNDPDQCSGKVNWQPPVAVDDCIPLPISAPGIPLPGTVVQTSGPLPGSVVAITCPPTPTTITYIATDGAGNTSSCTFQVMVVDTEKPEFDADITMPNDTTVNCHQVPSNCVYHGPLVCTPLTNSDVNDNCTSPQNLVVNYTQQSTQNPNPAVCGHYDYDLTRTWTVTDCAGNQLIHVQKIEVQDTTKPVALCKNITVTLDKNGKWIITPADINNGSFDNCAAPQFLTYAISQTTFTCANIGQNVVTLTVTDPCGNFSTCQAIVTVVEGIAPCTPQYNVQTSCLDNATTLENGQFQDIITVKALAMQTWRLTANNGGLFANNSPAPPAAGVVISVGTLFTAGTADLIDNDGDGQIDEADEMIYYTLRGRFTECVGYTISISNSTNIGMGTQATTSTISNKACYPTPYFLNLDGPFCISTPPFVIQVGEYNNAVGTAGSFMVNGVNTNIFNAGALGEGFHTVMATFDAGTATQNLVINGVQVGGSMADAIADPGCKQKITKLVQVTGTPTTVACNDLINISLDSSCVAVVFPDMVLEGTYYCFDDYTVTLNYPAGTTQFTPPNRVDATHINKVITYTLSHIISGNMCWGTVKVEDKLAPKLTCPADLTLACSEPTNVAYTGNVGIQDCSATTTQIDEEVIDNGECGNPRQIITRTFIVTDAWSNQSLCTQTITVVPFDLDDVVMPANITINCEVANANPGATLPNATGRPSINGAPIGSGGLCSASVGYTDVVLDICEGSYEIYRTWYVANTCLAPDDDNPITRVQRIRVNDIGGPVFSCPSDITVSVDPFSCCATAALPDVIVSEGCSNITDLEAKVTGVDPSSGNITTFTVPGSLADFPGNNYWTPDTLAVFLFTQCLPNGNTYTVRYTAADQCGNTSSCEFDLTVMDLVPPAVSCDEFTQVSLGSDGRIIVNASTFDDGTYDNCCLDGFEVARMIDGPCDQDTIADDFAPTVEFCCADLGDTITVVFRAYDCTGNTNDCMVQVYVDDKLKPVCSAPANVTVSCENFDPSLWAYGAATATDNCCMDTITTVVVLTNFDTTCNKGTITRRFTAVDCAGQTSTCTQRIVVNYEQDYYVRFPNDKILYACDSSFFDQPTFFGEDCELLAVSYHDDLFTVVPDACYKIERTWTIINWCTHNPNLDCIYVPNPNPNVNVNSSQNLPGPIVSAPGTTGPWAPTVVRINPTDPQPTNFSTFWDNDANCYVYKQIIKVIDTQDPVVINCPASPVEVCDLTPNDGQFWNEMYWWDNTIGSHDLCEAPTDLTITATDSCGGENVNIRYLLFLDLDQDGDMETVISSTNLPGFNNVQFGNATNPNFGGGTSRAFDNRPVSFNQKYGFALQTTVNAAAQTKTASVRWNTTQSPNTYAVPQLPYGTHKIKWIVEDGCGNETVCEYTFVVKDCKAPTVVCLNGLSANIMPTDMIVLWASDFLQYTEDNCTPTDQIKIAIRRKGAGTGFPTNPDGTPQTSVTFTCADLGTQFVELWGQDAAGNADYCETYIIVQDNAGNCSNSNVTVAGELTTEMQEGLQDAEVELNGMHPALPPINMFEQSEINGSYMFGNAMPVASNYTVTPTKDDDHLNGVSTFDLVLINKHILGIESFDSPYKIIAADANNSKSVTTFDIAEIRKLILGIYTELPNNTSWRFVDESYTFPNPDNPFAPAFPESKSVAAIQNNALNDDFVSVKVGDVNNTMIANNLMSTDDRTSSTMLFDVKDRSVARGEAFEVHFKADQFAQGYQFTLNLKGLEVLDIIPGEGMNSANFAVFSDVLTTSFDAAPGTNAPAEFTLRLRAKTAGSLSNMMNISSSVTKAEAYSKDAQRQSVALRFNGKEVRGVGFEVYQNQPNPWINRTVIGFHLPEADDVTLTVFDESGRMVYRQVGDFGKGHNAFTLDKELVNTTGLLYYQVSTSEESVTMKMIQTK